MESNFNSLAERMKARTEQEREQTEALFQQTLQNLSDSLQASSSSVLNTTKAAMEKEIANATQKLTSQCQSLGSVLSPLYAKCLIWSCLLVLMTAATLGSLIWLSSYQIRNLRQEVAELQAHRDNLEANYAQIWMEFKGLEPYESQGTKYLLTGKGWSIVFAGTLDSRNAWKIERRK